MVGSLTNEPYYFAINAYPALILAYEEGIKIDISAFDDWYNQPKRNKNILAFVEMAKNLQKEGRLLQQKDFLFSKYIMVLPVQENHMKRTKYQKLSPILFVQHFILIVTIQHL